MYNIHLKFLKFYLNLLHSVCRKFKAFKNRIVKIKVPYIKHPVYLRLGTSDVLTFEEIFLKHEYYPINCDSPKIIIDAGANIGLFAVLMKNKYPDAKIVCIEPDAENVEILKKNTSSYSNIYIENCGLWNKDTKLKVYDKFNLGKWGVIVEEDLDNGSLPAITVNSLLKKYSFEHIDILKIDIESSEKQLFSYNFDSWLPLVKCLVIELHDHIERGCSTAFFKAVNQCFCDYSFQINGETIFFSDVRPNH